MEMACRRGKKQKVEKTAAGDSLLPSVYLVVGHGVTVPAYSVVKVSPFSDGVRGSDDAPIPIPRHLARLEAKHCMSFVPVRSRHGPWIVGVGGNSPRDYGPETIVFDTQTQEVIAGPKLLSTKLHPVLLAVGSRIYALSRNPSVKGEVDFVPWFEVLDLSRAQVVDGRIVGCKWEELPRPPFFPWELSPRQYIFPPWVFVESYVAVDSYILLSITGQMGTHMFDVKTEEWAKLDEHDLPFTGGAIPHGPLFLDFSSGDTRAITAYKITVYANAAPSSSITEGRPSMSIVEFPIVTDMEAKEVVAGGGKLVSLGNHGFCSFTCSDDDLVLGCFQHTRELVTMKTYTTEDQLLSHDYLKSSCYIVVSNQGEQVYSVRDSLRGLTWPCLQDMISL
ncbi:unnamed protein product [Urochloa decumbens]|uniref:Uncharacterized protein n=1 Tax=Urochloa decumbens TaxID=240449 RepID=A0ABC9G5F2_9POAL